MEENIIDGDLATLFADKYAVFAISSNARAIPDARDGMKPVHRRILYEAMRSAPSSKATVKSASIVGSVLARWHPHGDASVYDALCRLAREHINNVLLITPQGSVGAIDGSGAAAPRYTEMKLSPIADWLVLDGVDDGAVPHRPNYDGRFTEPALLPAKLPTVLLNGVPGGSIGVGFASQIPPHNSAELARAARVVVRAMVEGREATVSEILAVMPGPDFPTGGLLSGPAEIAAAYTTGQGSMRMRGEAVIEDGEGRSGGRIVFTSIPYGLTTDGVLGSIGDAAAGRRDPKTKQRGEPVVPEVREVRDETTKDRASGEVRVRIVVDLKQGEDPGIVLEKLYKHTAAESAFSMNATVLDESGQPVVMSVVQLIQSWANFRADCVTRLAAAELARDRERQHVLEGLVAAIGCIDDVVAAVKESPNETEAVAKLRALINITTKQAEAILTMQLRRLTGLRRDELEAEAAALGVEIDRLLGLLTDPAQVVAHIEAELAEAERRLVRPRRTKIVSFAAQDARDFVLPEQVLLAVTGRGYLKRTSIEEFRAQNRGGKGRRGATLKSDDFLNAVVSCHSHDRLHAITDSGVVVRLEAHEVPEGGSGRHAANLGFETDEKVKALLAAPWPIPEDAEVVVATVSGEVKRVRLADLSSKMTKRLVFFRSSANDDIAGGILLENGGDVFLASDRGIGTRFSPSDIRLTKRDSGGVRGMDLISGGDRVVSIGKIESEDQLILCVTSDAIGKRVSSSQFPTQGRGGKGRILIKPKPGAKLVEALIVRDSDNVLIATELGMTVRLRVGDVKELGRSAMGVKLVSLKDGDRVVSAAVLPAEIEE
jgi:DNA gyrase subunit A